MKFNLTIDKKAEAVVERRLCINCGECRQICPTEAAGEYRKTVFCMSRPGNNMSRSGNNMSRPESTAAGNFTETRSEKNTAAITFADAKRQAVETSCSAGCPLGIVPQAVASLIAAGEIEQAAAHIRQKTPLPEICAAVCDQSCRSICSKSSFGDEPLNMRALERYVLSKTEAKPLKYIRKYNEKIAVIGGGPAGLSAAYSLAKDGYPVTVFEKDTTLGGALFWGIPDFRLDKSMVQSEIDRIISAGISVRYGWHVGGNHSIDELWDEGYSACLIAVGDSFGRVPHVPGADALGVYDAVKVMRQVTGGYDEGVILGTKVVIVGGGSFAADLARVLVRMGKDVTCVAAEVTDELPMPESMPDILAEEGIDLRTETAVGQIITENGGVKAVELVKGSASNYFCDTVIFATGQKCDVSSICNAETYPDGKIRIDDAYRTNKTMIFACGDVTGETESVVEAVAAGKAAAFEIHRTLHVAAGLEKAHALRNAPDVQAIYPENVVHGVAQHEEVLKSGNAAAAKTASKEAKVDMSGSGRILSNAVESDRGFMGSTVSGRTVAESAKSGAVSSYVMNLDMSGSGRILSNAVESDQGFMGGRVSDSDFVTDVAERVERAEDIVAVLRSAGIEEDMPVFEFAQDAAKVAVIGGGIAGITAALSLARKGYKPVIFEKESELGGSYRWLATDKRIDKSVLKRELQRVEAAGIEVIYNVSAGVRPDIEQLFVLGYDAVLFAIGTYGGGRHDIDGCDCSGVFDMAALMGRLADNEQITGLGDKVLVAGGDEMTLDISRRLAEFCSEVTVLTPWSRGFMQKRTGAVDMAVREGVNLVSGVEVVAIEQRNGRAYNAVCRVTDKGYTIKVPCDTVVLGGGGPDTDTIAIRNLRLDIDEDGYLAGNRNLATSIRGVFAIGDFDMSPADAGRTGAAAIDNYLSGKESYISLGDRKKQARPTEHEMIEGFKSEIIRGFECGYRILSDEQALIEAGRCMSCGYHRIEHDMCMGCGVCVRACPVNAIELVAADSMQSGALNGVLKGAADTTGSAGPAAGSTSGKEA